MALYKLAEQLVSTCKQQGLDYDPRVLPIKLTADCYIIYATPLSNECKSYGDCKVQQYYALTGGDTIKIVENP